MNDIERGVYAEMDFCAHASVGAAIGATTGSVAETIPLALVSHLGADSFPHWDLAHFAPPTEEGENQKITPTNYPKWVPFVVVADVLLAVWIVIWAVQRFPERRAAIISGAIAGVFFDFQYMPGFGPWMAGQWWYKPIKWLHEPGHIHFPLKHWQRWWGIHTQVVAAGLGIAWMIILPHLHW